MSSRRFASKRLSEYNEKALLTYAVGNAFFAFIWLVYQSFNLSLKASTNEWNRWVQSEKEVLATVMERYGFEWEQKGTHDEHLSDYDYKKKMRAAEVVELTEKVADLKKR